MENKKDKLYDIFLNYSYSDLMSLLKSAQTKEEQDFYIILSDMLLQKQQAKIIGK